MDPMDWGAPTSDLETNACLERIAQLEAENQALREVVAAWAAENNVADGVRRGGGGRRGMSVQQLQDAIADCHANLLAYLERGGLSGVGTEEHRAYVASIQTLERELDKAVAEGGEE